VAADPERDRAVASKGAGGRGEGALSERDKPDLQSYDGVVSDYLAEYAADAEREAEWFRRPKTIGEAIDCACGTRIPSGRGGKQIRHPTSAEFQ
jgi:hypothetical protein